MGMVLSKVQNKKSGAKFTPIFSVICYNHNILIADFFKNKKRKKKPQKVLDLLFAIRFVIFKV